VLTEQRPRMQSRAEVVPLSQGDGVIFPVHHRPVQGTRGFYRVNVRQGVSRSAPATATRLASSSATPNEGTAASTRLRHAHHAGLPVNSNDQTNSALRRAARLC
jgi:Oxygenase, catalysing oxidative methylation of damaged DNA